MFLPQAARLQHKHPAFCTCPVLPQTVHDRMFCGMLLLSCCGTTSVVIHYALGSGYSIEPQLLSSCAFNFRRQSLHGRW